MAEKDIQESIVGDSSKCPICLETCQELKILNCQHSFCLRCLRDLIKEMGELECPNCRKMHLLSDSGLQELSSNINKVETSEHLNQGDDYIKCCCGKYNADVYCQDCCQHLCTSCKKYHEIFPPLKIHTLQPIDANWLKDASESDHQSLCPLHEQKLELYCNICKVPICQKCVDEHIEHEGLHTVTTVSDAFNEFKLSANVLMVQADFYKQKSQVGINKCIENASKLSKGRVCLERDINNSVEEIVKLVREAGKELKTKLDDICETKKDKSNSQIDELESVVLDVEEKQEYITKLLKSDQATMVLQTCQQATEELQQMIAEVLPETEPRDDGKVYFTSSKDHILSALKQHGLGAVGEKPNEHIFVVSEYPKTVTRYQSFHVKITQTFKCEIDKNDLSANWKSQFESDRFTAKIEQVAEREYLVPGPINCEPYGLLTLNIHFCNAPIKGSPISIKVEPDKMTIDKLFNSIGVQDEGITDIFMSQNGFFLVVGKTNLIYKFRNTCEYISTITLLENMRVSGICQLKNEYLIVCDQKRRNITFFRQDGQFIKSVSTGRLSCPSGIDVNEELNLLYVADTNNCVEVFDMESYSKVKTIGSKGALEGQMNGPSCVAVTKEGNIIVADAHIPRIQLFDHEGQFIKILVGVGPSTNCIGKNLSRVFVDCEENIIVASEYKVQLFDKLGRFIKDIYQIAYGRRKNTCCVISIASHYPRRLSVAELYSSEIHVISY